MAEHKVTFEMPRSELGKKEIRIHINRAGGALGKLYISKAGIYWMPRGKKKAQPGKSVIAKWLSWRRLAEVMEQEGDNRRRHRYN